MTKFVKSISVVIVRKQGLQRILSLVLLCDNRTNQLGLKIHTEEQIY